MNAQTILNELRGLGKESYKRTLMKNHSVREPCFGVPISELKKIQKRIKNDHQVALDLYETANYDAMYLAGLSADAQRMTKKDLQRWADQAYAPSLASATVALVAAASPHGLEMGRKWIESPKALVASAGWATFSGLVAREESGGLEAGEAKELVKRVSERIDQAPDMVRYHMNGFVIAVGSYIDSLKDFAIEIGEEIGPITADLGNNSCQIPFAPEYIRKVHARRSARGK